MSSTVMRFSHSPCLSAQSPRRISPGYQLSRRCRAVDVRAAGYAGNEPCLCGNMQLFSCYFKFRTIAVCSD
jgi:hypothetical protein